MGTYMHMLIEPMKQKHRVTFPNNISLTNYIWTLTKLAHISSQPLHSVTFAQPHPNQHNRETGHWNTPALPQLRALRAGQTTCARANTTVSAFQDQICADYSSNSHYSWLGTWTDYSCNATEPIDMASANRANATARPRAPAWTNDAVSAAPSPR